MGESIDQLKQVLKQMPTKDQLATHFADSISAQEQLQRLARQQGEIKLLEESINQIRKLRREARNNGLSADEFPGLYK